MLALENRQSMLNQFVYENFSPKDLDDFVSKPTTLSKRLEKASLRLELEASRPGRMLGTAAWLGRRSYGVIIASRALEKHLRNDGR